MQQPPQHHGPTDMQMDAAIANMLRFGISLAATLMILGGFYYLRHPTMQPADYAHFHGTSTDLHNLGKVLTGTRLADSTSVLELGIVLLIATPVARVALCVVDFARQRDKLYVAVSFSVLMVLFYSLFRGGRYQLLFFARNARHLVYLGECHGDHRMSTREIGIIMNGVTGRMGLNQHLVRSVLAIRQQGGLRLSDGSILMPNPILVGRNAEKLKQIAAENNVARWTADLNEALANPADTLYFDAQLTNLRAAAVEAAIAAGKHIYCEKPIATDSATAMRLAKLATAAGVKHGVVQDKLYLPGLRKLKRLIDSDFFGRILSVRGEFGYWVFEGDWQPAQRPSWNYRKQDGGGIIVDMFCHWRYVLDHIFGSVKSVSCLGATCIPKRWDEQGKPYDATADDTAYGTFELEGGIVAQINSSWNFRVYRDELFSLQVDGTLGSAVAGLRECRIQPRSITPRPTWNPDVSNPFRFRDDWSDVPDNAIFDNGFKVQWEMFLRHIAEDGPWPHGLLEGAKGVQLAELGLKSWHERRWIDVSALTLEPGA